MGEIYRANLRPDLKHQLRTFYFVDPHNRGQLVSRPQLTTESLIAEIDHPTDSKAQISLNIYHLMEKYLKVDMVYHVQAGIEQALAQRAGQTKDAEKALDERAAALEAERYIYRVHGYDTRGLSSYFTYDVATFYSKGLLSLPGVNTVASGIDLAHPRIHLLVEDQSLEDRLPKTLKGIEVTVQEVSGGVKQKVA